MGVIVKPILFGLIENMQIRGHHSLALTEGVLYEKEKQTVLKYWFGRCYQMMFVKLATRWMIIKS